MSGMLSGGAAFEVGGAGKSAQQRGRPQTHNLHQHASCQPSWTLPRSADRNTQCSSQFLMPMLFHFTCYGTVYTLFGYFIFSFILLLLVLWVLDGGSRTLRKVSAQLRFYYFMRCRIGGRLRGGHGNGSAVLQRGRGDHSLLPHHQQIPSPVW